MHLLFSLLFSSTVHTMHIMEIYVNICIYARQVQSKNRIIYMEISLKNSLSDARLKMDIGVYELIIIVTIKSSFMLKWMFCAHSMAYTFKTNWFDCVCACMRVLSCYHHRSFVHSNLYNNFSTGFCLSTTSSKMQSRCIVKMHFNKTERP